MRDLQVNSQSGVHVLVYTHSQRRQILFWVSENIDLELARLGSHIRASKQEGEQKIK